jgi:competence protein ComEC
MMEKWEAEMLDCDFLKSPHHGSKTSSSVTYLNALTPEIVAVSAGVGNSYGLPKQEILDRYEKINAVIYRTDLQGDLVFVTDGSSIVYDEDYWGE